MANSDKLLSRIISNIVLAICVVAIPTIILLGVIAGRCVKVQGGAVIVDASLGVILLFTSLAAVTAPFVYRPVSVLAATSLARSWISASAQTSTNASILLPSTPQYLLAVGNLGVPSLQSFFKSLRYFFKRRDGVSPVFTQSTATLGSLLFMTLMMIIGDVWTHASSSAVLDGSVLGTVGLHDFSRTFAPPENSSDAPWRLQQGLRTFLGVNSGSEVVNIDNTVVLVPADIQSDLAVTATTIGMGLTCQLVNLDCIFDSNTNPATFDCSQILPGATGILSSTVNVTLYPAQNSSSLNLIAAMNIPTLFNESTTILPAQVFQCSGSLRNVTYTGSNGGFTIVNSSVIALTRLTELWNLNEFAGKSAIIESALGSIGTSTIVVQGTNTTTAPDVFGQGLSRLFVSLLSGQTIPSPALMEWASKNAVLSRIPLAPIVFLCVMVTVTIIAISILGFRALLAVIHPPMLEGNPISVDNLHGQLTSPIEVLKNTIGDTPLAMKIVFNGQSHHSVEFDVPSPPPTASETNIKLNTDGLNGGETGRRGSGSRRGGEMSQEEERVVFEMQQRRAANVMEAETPLREPETPVETEFEDISPVSLRYSWGQRSFLPMPK